MSDGRQEKKIGEFYAQEDTVESYDATRFGNKGGRHVDRTEKEILIDFMKAHPIDQPVLEIAAGTGRFSLELARRGYKVIAMDKSRPMLRMIQSLADKEGLDITCIEGDAFSLPFNDNAFETVYSFRFVWHFKDYPQLISEFARVSRNRVVFDMMNTWSLASLSAPVANHLVYRSIHTQTASKKDVLAAMRNTNLTCKAECTAFVFPYIFYRNLPWLTSLFIRLEKITLAVSKVGSVNYFCAEKSKRA